MDIKDILQQSKKNRLLKDNPTAKQVAEIVVSETVNPIIQDVNDTKDQLESVKTDLESAKIDLDDKITNTLKGDPGDDGYTPVKGKDYFTGTEIADFKAEVRPIKGRDYFDGEPGQDGKTPTKKELEDLIKPLIPEPQAIDTDSIASEASKRSLDELKPLIEANDTIDEIIDKLNETEDSIEIKVIKGLDNLLKRIQKSIKEKSGGGGGDIVYVEDLSSQTNGITLTFTVPKHRKALMVVGSDFPSVLFENNGFTTSGNQLTLTVSNAPSQGSQLGFQYVK
jgi:hypothetical protein